MAKIGIDARLWGVKHGGIGRYVEQLVKNLDRVDKKNEYVVFCRSEDIPKFPDNWKKVVADIRHYSLKEQLILPGIFSKEKLDLLHIPHLNVPLLYRGKMVITIHDLLWHDLRGLSVTTLPAPVYFAKYIAYRIVVRSAIKRASKIIVPSESVKQAIIDRFGLLPDKLVVTYEGVSSSSTSIKYQNSVLENCKITKPYILYVGSLYPHKNIESVVSALVLLQKEREISDIKLVVAGSRNVFQDRFKKFLKAKGAANMVKIVGSVDDHELAAIYKSSEAFVYPTLSEGFGLPGLEAMANGTPVICSDISVLREIYGPSASYFNPRDVFDIAIKIKEVVLDKKKKNALIKKGQERIKLYSWQKMAQESLELYNSLI